MIFGSATVLSKVFESLESVRFGGLYNAEACFQTHSSSVGKVVALVMSFCVCCTFYRVHWGGKGG